MSGGTPRAVTFTAGRAEWLANATKPPNIHREKRNRWLDTPKGLDPLAARAMDYALHVICTTGSGGNQRAGYPEVAAFIMR